MAVTWTISTLERNTDDDGVIVAHWRVSDVDGEHSGSSYGTSGFSPDPDADGFLAFADIEEATAIQWCKDSMGEEAVTSIEESIAAQIAESKAPSVVAEVPW